MDEQRKDCKVCTWFALAAAKKQISTWLRSRNPLLQQPDTGLTVALYANTEQIWTQSCTLAISMVRVTQQKKKEPSEMAASSFLLPRTQECMNHPILLGPIYLSGFMSGSVIFYNMSDVCELGIHPCCPMRPSRPPQEEHTSVALLTISKDTLIPMIVIYVSGCCYNKNTQHGWLQQRRIHPSSQAASWEHSWAKH